MKNLKLSSKLLLLSFVAIFFASCSKNNSSHIPKDAFAVAVFDGKSWKETKNLNTLYNNEDFKETLKQVKEQSEKLAELIEKLQKNPDELGIFLTKKSYAFAAIEKDEIVYGAILSIDKKKLEENLDLIGKELGMPISLFLETKNDIKFVEPSQGMILGWNKDVFMFIGGEEENVNFELLEKYLNLKENESILANADYKKFYKNCKDINLWISSDITKKFEADFSEMKEFENLTGIEIAGNYGHAHIEFAKEYVTFTSSLRFNKSIQNLDSEKLIKNADAITNFFAEIGEKIYALFDSNYNNDQSYDGEYDISDEEWERILSELETE